jgi:hypothetical protein
VLINLGVKLFLIFGWHAHIFVVLGVVNTAKLSTWARTTSGGERNDGERNDNLVRLSPLS